MCAEDSELIKFARYIRSLDPDPLELTSSYDIFQRSSPWNPTQPAFTANDSLYQQEAMSSEPSLEAQGSQQQFGSFPSSHHYGPDIHDTSVDWDMVEPEPSQAFSGDIAQFPRLFMQHPLSPAAMPSRHQPPSEPEVMQLDEHADAASTNADTRAGIAMESMEGPGLDSEYPMNSQMNEQFPAFDSKILSTKDAEFPAHPNNDRAYIGGRFTLSEDNQQGNVAECYSQPLGTSAPSNDQRIQIPRSRPSCDRHEPGISGSFPTTDHKYPPFIDLTSCTRTSPIPHARDINGCSRKHSSPSVPKFTNLSPPARTSGPRTRPRRRTTSSVRSDLGQLVSIAERRESSTKGESNKLEEEIDFPQLQRKASRAKRTGPLPEEKKSKASQMRRDKSTCLGCKNHKISVRYTVEIMVHHISLAFTNSAQCCGNMPCTNCIKSREGRFCLNPQWRSYVEGASYDHACKNAQCPPCLTDP